MPAPTFSEARQFKSRVEGDNRANKAGVAGGPFERAFKAVNVNPALATDYEETPEFRAEHPRYPDYVYPDDSERDTRKAIKSQLAQSKVLGDVKVDESDVEYILDKKNVQEMALFMSFLEDSFPRGTPWAQEYFNKICPGWYKSKMEIIEDKLALIKRFIWITQNKIENMDDALLIWKLYTGKIIIPATFEELIHGPAQANEATFASGFFCPRSWTDQHMRMVKRNQAYLANFAIPGIDTKGLAGNALKAAVALAGDEMGQSGWFEGPKSTAGTSQQFWGTRVLQDSATTANSLFGAVAVNKHTGPVGTLSKF